MEKVCGNCVHCVNSTSLDIPGEICAQDSKKIKPVHHNWPGCEHFNDVEGFAEYCEARKTSALVGEIPCDFFLFQEPPIHQGNDNPKERGVIHAVGPINPEKDKTIAFSLNKEHYDKITECFSYEMIQNIKLFQEKHTAYGKGNIAAFQTFGVLVRMNDKFERLKNLLLDENKNLRTPEQIQEKLGSTEGLEDTMRDISNYATIMLLCWKGEWK